MRLEINVAGFDQLAELLAGPTLTNAAQSAVDEAGALIFNRIKKRFLAQESPEGVAWEPSYAAFRRSFGIGRRGQRVKSGGGTLFDTGTLFHSIQLFSVDPLERAIGTDVFYAPFHNFGTDTLPQREFLGFGESDYDLALRVFLKNIQSAFQGEDQGSV